MKTTSQLLFAALIVAAPYAAMAQVKGSNNANPPKEGTTGLGVHGGNGVARCSVVDLDQFNRLIATKPTVSEFRNAYSCVTLVLPGDISTREMRYDSSRYFAEMGEFGRITGGHFY